MGGGNSPHLPMASNRTSLPRTTGLLATWLAVLSSFGVAARAEGQTISNTASASWDVGNQRVSTPSNRVDLTVGTLPPQPITISTHRFNASTGSATPVGASQCRHASGSSPITLGGAFAGLSTNPGQLSPTNIIQAGEPLVVQIAAATRNSDASTSESFDIELSFGAAERETISVIETGVNTGIFTGFINTKAVPPAVVAGDCVLSVAKGEAVQIIARDLASTLSASVDVTFLVDPFGETFDSGDGTAISGNRVTLINADTGQPATVFGDDGVSAFPSSVLTGSTVTDASGLQYAFPTGFYRFPFAPQGRYFLRVEPISPYVAPSVVPADQLTGLTRSDGQPFTILPASYGAIFTLDSPAPVRVDIPLDRPGSGLALTKQVSAVVAEPGDVLRYQITVRNSDAVRPSGPILVTDQLPAAIRLRRETVRLDGQLVPVNAVADGSSFSLTVPSLAGGRSASITYLTEVRQDARDGEIANLATARDSRGTQNTVQAEAVTRIVRDGIAERFTIIGRVTEDGCTIDPRGAKGIANVRVMLQDGTYTVTDENGRYHFEGVRPGLHVVQIAPESLPLDQAPVDCAANSRSAGNPISRFVEGRGGSLQRADFYAVRTAARAAANSPAVATNRPAIIADRVAAGADRDWFDGQAPGIRFLFPEADHNPRNKAIRVAILHDPSLKVELSLNGEPVNPLRFDGSRTSPDGLSAVSLWRGIELADRDNRLVARVVDQNGKLIMELDRSVHYATSAMSAQMIPEQSTLVADGVTRPILAVRLTDRDGRPARHGLTGTFTVSAPYSPAVELDAQQADQLAGLERAAPVYQVQGDDGIAYIELTPTTASGSVSLDFKFQDGRTERNQRIEGWIEPGNLPWTVVGFAAGTIGFNTLDSNIQDLTGAEDDFNVDGRVALYAKGRVSGQWLMTMTYDSDKERDETRFGGVIDPRSYYTIYADRSEQRYDASSIRKLYLKLETRQFYALFGDFDTGINEPLLTRYQRTMNGVKAEFRSDNIAATAFAADTPTRYRREEIQGNGLSGPYALAARDVLINSERITLEVRDRLRADQIIKETVLMRHIDYDVDYLAGTLRFREPILSRDFDGNPQFIVAEYEVDGVGETKVNAGGRVAWQNDARTLQIAATAIHDENDISKTNLAGLDVRYRPDAATEIRAEIAGSKSEDERTGAASPNGLAMAMVLEAEHHGSDVDLLAYYRRQENGFGVGQISASQDSSEKIGFDSRLRITEQLSVGLLAWQERFLATGARRRAASGEIDWTNGDTSLRGGLVYAHDRLASGDVNRSTLLKLGGSQRLFDGKLELDAQSEIALGNDQNESIDFPSRHKIGARLAVTDWAKLVAGYEVTDGKTFDSQTIRAGFELEPWAGARILALGNQQNLTEFGPRSYASYGFSQSVRLNEHWSIDASLDGNETFSGAIDPADVLNPAQPVTAGGFLTGAALTEDFIATTLGATYRNQDWSWATRLEYRAADTGDRYGFTSALLKQIGGGTMLGGLVSYFHAELDGGPTTDRTEIELSWANRRDDSRWSFLNKLSFYEDKVRNAVSGAPGPIGGAPLLVDGDVTSRRIVNSFSANYTPIDHNGENGTYLEDGEYSFFWGTRYVFDKFGPDDVKGWSNLIGADIKFDLGKHAMIGATGNVRIGTDGSNIAYAGGPTITVVPFKNSNLTLGYNVIGFEDRDFEESRYTRDGAFVTFKLKFDQNSLADLIGN